MWMNRSVFLLYDLTLGLTLRYMLNLYSKLMGLSVHQILYFEEKVIVSFLY